MLALEATVALSYFCTHAYESMQGTGGLKHHWPAVYVALHCVVCVILRIHIMPHVC